MFPRKSDDTRACKQHPSLLQQQQPQLAHSASNNLRNDITREPERARHVQPSAAAVRAALAVGGSAADTTAVASHNNNGRMRRPPGLPAACSSSNSSNNNIANHKNRASIVNLDKNRIRQTRRLLPRPLSLPSGFNLMRQLGKLADVAEGNAAPDVISADQSADMPATVDIALIKQLEDDIYNRKENGLPNKSQCRNGGASGDCPHCSAAFVPNQVVERRTIQTNVTRDSVANQAIMLLDAWQMEPLLMKYAKPTLAETSTGTAAEIAPTEGTRSIIIIDNSSYYPTVMKYDIRTQPRRLEEQTIVGSKKEPAKLVDAPPKTHSSNLFQRCLGRPTDGSASDNEPNEGDDDHERINVHASPPPMPPSQRKLSKFKRFVLQRRSLNLNATCVEPSPASMQRTNAPPTSTRESPPSPIPPVATCNDDGGVTGSTGRSDSTADLSQLKSDKHATVMTTTTPMTTTEHQSHSRHRWLHTAVPTKNTTTDTLSSYGRQWRSDDDIYSSIVVSDAGDASRPARNGEHPDLRELERMQRQLDQLSADLDEKRRQLQLQQLDEPRTAAIKKRSPSMLMLFGQAAQKRHSIGSPTDVVKTWVYRRR